MAQTDSAKPVHATLGSAFQQQAYIKASNTNLGDKFGSAIAMSGDTLIVGAKQESSDATGINGDQDNNDAGNSGAAYIFTRSGATWTQQAYLKASNTHLGDAFGFSVAIDGDTAVVGARFEDSATKGINGDDSDTTADAAGAAFVFTRDGTTWTQQAYLKASNTDFNDGFGHAVGISGNTIVVGAQLEQSNATGVNGTESNNDLNGAGAAYIFTRDDATWTQQAYIKASNTDGFDFFGETVAIEGDTVVVGTLNEASNATGINGDEDNDTTANAGAAYVFTRSDTTWTQQAYIKASNAEGFDRFGKSLAISGDTLVVGAYHEDSNATGINGNQDDNSLTAVGAAYVFTRSDSTWTQQAYIKASNAGDQDFFGNAVAIVGDTLVVAASNEKSNATGVNGDQSDNSTNTAGAVYVYTRSDAAWSQLAYLKASNTWLADEFGNSVTLVGDTVVASAVGEDSNATGINGDQSNNSFNVSGAVYVFELVSTFTVGGTLAGLAAGESVTLQNNGGDDLVVNDNGSFVFSTELADGNNYAISVVAPPTCPSATCIISNGSGTLSGDDVSNVRVQLRDEVHDDSFEDPPEP